MSDQCFHNDIAGSTRFTRTSTNAEATFPVENAKTDQVFDSVRSTGVGNWYYTFDGSSANSIKRIVLLNINTAIWTTLQAQGDNADFAGAPAATQNFTIVSRTYGKYDAVAGEVSAVTRYDAFCVVDWDYEDFRILLNSTDVSYYEIGRIYIATEARTSMKSPDWNTATGLETGSTITEGSSGQYIEVPRWQRFNYTMQFKAITRDQREWLEKEVSVNPSVVWWVEGLTGELIFGKVKVPMFQNYDTAFGNNNYGTCQLIESL